jgi:hypothetical protein
VGTVHLLVLVVGCFTPAGPSSRRRESGGAVVLPAGQVGLSSL